jgi:ribonuclease D
MHRVRRRRELAVVRSLWERRDELAQQRDISPGRVLPDLAIVEAALAAPTTELDLVKLPLWGGRSLRRQGATWLPAIAAAAALSESDLPEVKARHDGPPPARSWAERDPLAAARLSAARATVVEIAERNHLPVENLLSPDALRRVMWQPPEPADAAAIAAALRALGARPWQVDLTAAPVAAALLRPPPAPEPPETPPAST